METSCDEVVLCKKSIGERGDYATALLKFTVRRSSLTPLAFSENDTKGRVKNIMNMKKTKLWVSGLAGVIVLGLIVGFATNSHKDLSEKLKTSVEGEMELRYFGTMSPALVEDSSYVPNYYESSIMAGTIELLNTVLPEYFSNLSSPEFEWNSKLLSENTLEQVKNHITKTYLMADCQVSSSHQGGNKYLLNVKVLPINALTGLSEDTLNAIKSDENLVGNVDMMVEEIISHLVSPEKADVCEEYTVPFTYRTNDGFYPETDEIIEMYDSIVVFQLN